MYRYLLLCLALYLMKCPVRALEDYYDAPTERIRHRESYAPVYNGNVDERRIPDIPRHTHRSASVSDQNFGNNTIRNYITSNARNSTERQENKNIKRKSQDSVDGSRMLYPSEIENLTTSSPINAHIRSRNCSYGLCDEVDNYPLDKIKRILSKTTLKNFFSAETIPTFENRFGEGENICSTITHTRFPKTAKNMQNKERVIVNVDQYKQGIRFETCKEEGPCNYVENFPNDFTPMCVQKYTVRKLMVVGKDSDDTVFEDFQVPSCCVCVVKK